MITAAVVVVVVVVIMFEAAKCSDRLSGLIAVLPLDLGTRLALGTRVFSCGMWDVGCGSDFSRDALALNG